MMNCMEDNAPSRKTTFSQTEGSSKKGGLRLRWLDSILKYLKTLDLNVWWKKARDRDLLQGKQGAVAPKKDKIIPTYSP
jgi:hypothetical protein